MLLPLRERVKTKDKRGGIKIRTMQMLREPSYVKGMQKVWSEETTKLEKIKGQSRYVEQNKTKVHSGVRG